MQAEKKGTYKKLKNESSKIHFSRKNLEFSAQTNILF
jgi:ubiquitin